MVRASVANRYGSINEGRLDEVLNEVEGVLDNAMLPILPCLASCGEAAAAAAAATDVVDMAALLEPTPILERDHPHHLKSPFAPSNLIIEDESTTAEFLKIFSSITSTSTTPREDVAEENEDSYTDIMPLEWNSPREDVTKENEGSNMDIHPLDWMTPAVYEAPMGGVFTNYSSPAATLATPRMVSSASTTGTRRSPSSRHPSVKVGQWQERVTELLHFRDEFGHCLVPHNWSKNRKLAQWVKRQRYQHRLLCQGRHSTLSMDRVVQLEEIGFVWNSHKAGWDDKFQQLVEFNNKYGHCNVPSTWTLNPSLAIWVKFQRRQYKVKYSKNRVRPVSDGDDDDDDDDAIGNNALTDERVQRLLALGFSFDPRNTLGN